VLSLWVPAHAEWDRTYEQYDGNGWSMSADGVMTIESNEGWIDFLRYGIIDYFNWFIPEKVMI
jgi:hypothetical protein